MLGDRATTTDDAAIPTLPFLLGLGEVVFQGHLNPLFAEFFRNKQHLLEENVYFPPSLKVPPEVKHRR